MLSEALVTVTHPNNGATLVQFVEAVADTPMSTVKNYMNTQQATRISKVCRSGLQTLLMHSCKQHLNATCQDMSTLS